MKINKALYALLLLSSACAVVVHPTGGPQDTDPPTAVYVQPDTNQLNFNERSIRITFDEFIELKDPNGILFSPPLPEKPKTSISGKTLTITPKNPLAPNTTYSIQLVNAINDVTEKNVIPLYTISFSTGAALDTNFIQGHVYDNLTGDALSNAVTALYNADKPITDTLPFPNFISKTKADGSFYISGIKTGKYYIASFEDINNNLKLEQGEKIAFRNETITIPDTNGSNINLYAASYIKGGETFQLIPGTSLSRHAYNAKVLLNKTDELLVVSQPPRNAKEKSPIIHLVNDSLKLFDPYADSIQSYYFYVNQVIKDTIKVKYSKKPEITSLNLSHSILPPFDTLSLLSNIPIQAIDKSGIVLLKDSIPIAFTIKYKDPYSSQLLFERSEKSSYKVIINANAIKDVMQTSYKGDTLEFQTPEEKNYGNLVIKWNNPEKRIYRVELLKDKTKAADFTLTSSNDSVSFNLIPADEYYIRIYLDTSISPSLSTKLFRNQPPRVYYATNKAKLRGGWTVTDIFINIKDD